MPAPTATFNSKFFKDMPIGIFTSTPEGRHLFANAALADMLGYETPEELIESITDIASQVYANPEDRYEFMPLILEHDKVVDHETKFKRKDGTINWVSTSAHAVFDDQGNIIQQKGINTDITRRKQSEDGLG